VRYTVMWLEILVKTIIHQMTFNTRVYNLLWHFRVVPKVRYRHVVCWRKSGSRVGFINSGRIWAPLNAGSTGHLCKETLTIAVMIEINSSTHNLRNYVGIGSKLVHLLGGFMKIVFILSSETRALRSFSTSIWMFRYLHLEYHYCGWCNRRQM